jgi:hypothetical protein
MFPGKEEVVVPEKEKKAKKEALEATLPLVG